MRDPAADLYLADKGLLETIVGFRMHQGIMAVARVPAEPDLDELVQSSRSPHLFVAIDGLVFAENVGVVVRNCAAFDVQGILVGPTSASPYLRRAVRNSMGTVFHIPVIHSKSLSESLNNLRTKYATSVLIADAHTDTSLYDQNLVKDVCLVFGNEDTGVSPEVESNATAIVRIPMNAGVDSLNVASASAVMLGEVSRQRSLV
jgi:tRNA G18 (ribose-2'-O)-methylase SpoU